MQVKLLRFLILLAILVFADQASKIWSENNLLLRSDQSDSEIYQGSKEPIFKWSNSTDAETDELGSNWIMFQFNYVRNHGAAWGTFSSLSDSIRLPIFHVLTVVFCAFFIGVAFKSRLGSSLLFKIGVALMVSGATGNLIDRVTRGYVVDLLDLRWSLAGWVYALPVFNLADLYVIIGVFLFSIPLLSR